MATPAFKVHSSDEAETLMRLCREVHYGGRPLPPEIINKKKEIEIKTRNAELFTARLRQIDQGMINEIVALKHQLDSLYSRWIVQETPRLA